MGINKLGSCGLMRKIPMGILMLLFAVLLFPQAVTAQNQKVILPAREVTVRMALGEIEKQTDFKVAVNWDNLDAGKKVLFPASMLTVKEIMDKTLTESGCAWEMIGNQIAVVYDSSENYTPQSAMHRDRLPAQMKVVKDPWSTREVTTDEISRIRNGYWRSDDSVTDSLGLAVLNFRVNSTKLERDYMGNAKVLDLIHKTFSDKELLTAMDFITVTAAASPEGSTAGNDKLAADRAMSVKSYLMWKYPFMDRDRILTFSIGEDWTGLRKMVSDDETAPYRDQVLTILDSELDSNAKRTALKRLGNGSAYRYIADNMLPKLRGAAACMIYYKEDPKPVYITETQVDTVYVDRIVEKEVEVIVEQEPKASPYYFAVKTNLLYDIALLPDLALEFSLGNRWSIEIGGQWSWWSSPTDHEYCWRIQSAGLELRKWLGKKDRTPLTGHYLGLYGMAGTYDVRFNNKTGYLSDMSYSFGLSYGYALPIGRSWNLEFGLAVGYLGGEYQTYGVYNERYEIFPKIADKKMNYFGPTKAKVSLVWLIGSGKNATKK